MSDALLLPPGAVLLHIGPFKTGSTALQSALFDRRAELDEHGVAYPGSWRRLYAPGHAVLGWAPRGRRVPPLERWHEFAREVRDLGDRRVVVSTEDFGRIYDPAVSKRIVEDLGPDRVHVLAVARAYHRLLPSHWQERVKSLQRLSYDEFLTRVLDTDKPDRAFHASHDVARMAAMWLPHLGPDRFTLVVSDDSDRDVLPRTTEAMLGLPRGLLATSGTSVANQSLSFEATEMLRRLNARFADRGWDDRAYRRFLRDGLTASLQAAGRSAGESGAPPLPSWAVDRVRELSEARVAAIHSSGVRVVGDVAALLPPDDLPVADGVPEVDTVAADTVVAAAAGIVEASLRDRREGPRRTRARGKKARAPRGRPLDETGSKDLLREVAWRQGQRLRRLPGTLRGSGGSQ